MLNTNFYNLINLHKAKNLLLLYKDKFSMMNQILKIRVKK